MNSVQAKNEVMQLASSVLGGVLTAPNIRWPGQESLDPPAATATWAKIFMTHNIGQQGSLAGDTGMRRWNRQGIITIQCFVPTTKAGATVSFGLACDLRDAFQSYSAATSLWFRNANAKEVGPDASWYQANMTVNFEYDEVK